MHWWISLGVALSLSSVGMVARASPLSLADAVAEAKKSSTDLGVARARITVANAGYASAGKLIATNPTLSLGYGTAAPFGNGEERSWSFGLSQTIEIGGQQSLRKQLVGAEVAESEAEERRVRNELVADVVVTFYALDGARRIQRMQEDVAQIYGQLLAIARTNLEKGVGTKPEVLSLEIELTRVKADSIGAKALADALQAQLAGLLGRTGPAEIEPTTTDVPANDADLDVDALVKEAIEKRPELAAARSRQRLFRVEGSLATREAWLSPTFGAGVQYERMAFGLEGFRLAPGGVPGLLGIDEKRTSLMLSVSIPLPFFNARSGDVARANAGFDLASVEERAAKIRVEAEVRSAAAFWKGARDSFALFEKARPAMTEAASAYREAFEKRAIALGEVLLGEERVARARVQYLSARGNFLRARALLDKATGSFTM